MAKIITSKPEVLWNLKCILGEGTLWVKEHNSIYFTDIKKKRIHILNLKNKKKRLLWFQKSIRNFISRPAPLLIIVSEIFDSIFQI